MVASPPARILSSLGDRAASIGFFVKQDLIDRYRSDVLGVVWLFLQPLIYIALFSAVFSTLMQARLPGVAGGFGYTVYLIAGLLAWNAFSQSFSRLSTWYRDRAHLYRKVPLGLVSPPVSVPVSEFVIYVISMALFAIFLFAIGHPITWNWLWLIPVLMLLLGFSYGLGIVVGMLEVFIPDLRRFVPILLQIGFWVTPIVYTIDILPASMQAIQSGNPMAPALASVQRIVVYGQPPQAQAIGVLVAIVLTSGIAMMALHHRIKKALRDAL